MDLNSDINMRNHQLFNLRNPVNPDDAATKHYVDSKLVVILERMNKNYKLLKKIYDLQKNI